MTWQINTTASEDTEAFAERIGQVLRGGEVIELASDLGGGKTTFTRGLVRGMGSHDTVASPTFTISKVYAAKDLDVHHFDFYRLAEAGIVASELAEVTGDPHIVTVVEWADIVQDVLPAERLSVVIKQTPSGTRDITFICPESLSYIMEAVKR